MRVEDLSSLGTDATIDTDLVIIGGGPAGLTIAREFFGTSTRVLIVESGKLVEDPQFTDLNAVESVGEPKGEAARRRIECHGPHSPSWSDRKSTRLNSSHLVISYAVFCLKKKNKHPRAPHQSTPHATSHPPL